MEMDSLSFTSKLIKRIGTYMKTSRRNNQAKSYHQSQESYPSQTLTSNSVSIQPSFETMDNEKAPSGACDSSSSLVTTDTDNIDLGK